MDVKRPRRGHFGMGRMFFFLCSMALFICQLTGLLQFNEFFYGLSIAIAILGSLSMLQIDKQQKEISNLKKNLAKKDKENEKLRAHYQSLSKKYKELQSTNEATQRQLIRSKNKNKKRSEKRYILETFSNFSNENIDNIDSDE